MTNIKKPYAGTQTLIRGINVLQRFSDEKPEWSVTDLAEVMKLNRTTTYRLLTALESEGLILRDQPSENYRLGSELVVLGSRALRANPLRTVAHPELLALTAECEESCWLDVLDGLHTLTLDEVRGKFLLSMASSVGARWPAHACSTGKVLLAFADPSKVNELLKTPLMPLTEHTITDAQALLVELEKVRRVGFSVELEELEIGHSSVSTPIFNHHGLGIAAISISGPIARLSKENLEVLSVRLKQSSARISFQLGYRMEINR